MQRHFLVDRVVEFSAFVPEVKVELAVRAENERVHGVVVVAAFDAGEQQLAFVGLAVAIGVGQHENIGRTGDNHLVAQHTNAERGVDAGVLVENGFLVRDTVTMGVFQNHDAVAFRLQNAPFLEGRTIIDALGDPDASALINVHVGWVMNHRLGSEERRFETVGYGECLYGFTGSVGADAGGIGGRSG